MKKHILFYSLIAIIFASCSKDNNETNILDKPKEETEEPLKPSPNTVKSVNGGFYKPNVGGPNQPNQVFIDLSTGEQTAVKRDSWDFAFLCDPKDHRVILNNTIKMAAKKLETTNIDEVQDIDEAICQINCNTAGFSSVIFTDSDYSASYFVNNVKTDNIYVNMLPNGRDLDFDLNLFFKKKKIICHDGMMDKLFGGSYE